MKLSFINKKTVMALLIVAVMVFSIEGFMLGRDYYEKTVAYNSHKFKITENGIFTTINGKELRFDYLPEDVESITVDNETAKRLAATRMLYSTSNYTDINSPAIAAANYEMAQTLNKYRGIYLEAGFIGGEQKRVINCSMATPTVPVILLKTGQLGIEVKGNCIIARADDAQEFARIKDRLLYAITGVI